MKQHILPALKLTLVCLLFFSGFYTLIIFGIAQFSPNNGKGEIVTVGNKKYYAYNDEDWFSFDNLSNSSMTSGVTAE